ncbi:MAG: hypothetical protein WDZ85_00120 [Candidatus Paceibacterota bacterium]
MNYFNKKTITAFVLGMIFILFALHALNIYQLRAVVFANQVDIAEIAQFLNSQIEATQGLPQAGQQ